MKPSPIHLSIRRLVRALTLVAVLCPVYCPAQAHPAPEVLYRELGPLVRPLLTDPEIQTPGLQVGVVTPGYSGSFAWGSLSHLRREPPTPETLYEIASFTKPFVATLVAQAVLEKRFDYADPIAPCGPEQTSALCYRGLPVSWLDLISHHAALPALPDNLNWSSWQPTREYRREQLTDFLATFRLSASPGRGFSYSSLGYAIIGQKLEVLYGQDLAGQLRQLTDALGMPDTRVHLDSEQRLRLAPGYLKHLPIPYGEQHEGLTASSGLKSSMRDLLIWLQHQLGVRESTWGPAIAMTHQVTPRGGAPLCKMALGWLYYEPSGWYWHSGSAPGFKSFMAFDLKRGTGVIILANAKVSGIKMEPVGIRLMTYLNSL
ncbi:MAG: serine hydrolase domain-containing protein [Candidatus Sericytochromatia bacterium]